MEERDERRVREIVESYHFVTQKECNENSDTIDRKLSNDNARLAVMESQQKINNVLTGAIASGVIALVVKVYLGG